MIPANKENPKGFFERRDIRALNDKHLHSMGCDWSEISNLYEHEVPAEVMKEFRHDGRDILQRLKDKSLFGVCAIKEPRLCLLMPSWQKVLGDDCFYLLVHREPAEIALSLYNRNEIPFEVSTYLTEQYLRRAFASIGQNPFHIISFRELIEDPVNSTLGIINALNRAGLNLPLPNEKKLAEFATPALYRSKLKNETISISKKLKSWHQSLSKNELPRVRSSHTLVPKAVLDYQHKKRFSEYDKTATELGHKTKRISTLESQIIPNQKLTEKLEAITENISAITTEFPDKSEDLARSKAELVISKVDLDLARSKLDQARIELDQTKSKKSLISSQLAERLSELERNRFQLKTMSREIELLTTKVNAKENELTVTATKLEEKSGALEDSKVQLQALTREIDLLITKVNAKENELTVTATKLEEKSGALEDRTAQLKTQSGEIEHLARNVREWEIENNKINSSLKESEAQFRLTVNSLKQKEDQLLETQANFDLQAKRLIVTAEKLKVTRNTVRRRNHKINKFNKASDVHLQNIKTKNDLIDKLISQSGEQQIRIDHQLEQQQSLQTKLLKRDQELLIALSEQKNLGLRISKLTHTLTESRGETATTYNELQKSRIIIEKLRDDSNEFHEISDNLATRISFLFSSFSWKFTRPFLNIMLRPFHLGFGRTILTDIKELAAQSSNWPNQDYEVLVEADSTTEDEGVSTESRVSEKPVISSFERLATASQRFDFLFKQKERPTKIGFTVSEVADNTSAGDYYTAKELAYQLNQQLGWNCNFLPQKHPENHQGDWYQVSELDCLIVMLDKYDLRKIENEKPGLLKIAWIRNWADMWTVRPWFRQFDILLCTSNEAATFIKEQTGRLAHVFKIASNTSRFSPQVSPTDELSSDYCFTGNYWGAPRVIEQLRPDELGYRFALWGRGWEDHDQFKGSLRGNLPYTDLPSVYRSTQLVIDDANHATAPWGSVNSRVFDALACGTLVITNGAEGAKETFGGLLPTYNSGEELTNLIEHFINHPEEREQLAQRLQHIVTCEHSYETRALELKHILSSELTKRARIAIKLPVPNQPEATEWGDFHFGNALANAFRKLGYTVRLDFLPEWYSETLIPDDITITLRGLSQYRPKPGVINLMWVISHPELITAAETDEFDHVFVASDSFAESLKEFSETNISTLLQCTDPDRFKLGNNPQRLDDIVFVGNSRNQTRPIVENAISAKVPFKIIGNGWSDLVDKTYIAGKYIENSKLGQFYSGCGVLLCDHWPEMQRHGFISNRLFDAAACGAVCISDDVPGIDELFDHLVYIYSGEVKSLKKRLASALSENPELRHQRVELAEKIAQLHNFENRAKSIDTIIKKLFVIRKELTENELALIKTKAHQEKQKFEKANNELEKLRSNVMPLESETHLLKEPSEASSNSKRTNFRAKIRSVFNTTQPKPEPVQEPVELVPTVVNKPKQTPPIVRKYPGTALVITWDIGHNPVGRSYMLAEVLDRIVQNVIIIGFQFPRYGDDIWEPLRRSRIPIINLPGSNFPEFFKSLEKISERIQPDFVFACKSRLPSTQLGAMIKNKVGCPLFLDIDDHELTFFKEAAEVSIEELEKMPFGSAKDEVEPYEKLWTGLAQNTRRFADEILVSNEALQSEFGGTIIPHVRDENTFDPKLFDQASIRSEFDIPENARVVLFLGTPRLHKGIELIANAVANLKDDHALLVVVGNAPDKRDTATLKKIAGNRVKFIQNQPFEKIPAIVSMANAICLAQDVTHPISKYQLPAKAIDAIAMGIPLLVTATQPLKRLIDCGAALEITTKTIDSVLARVLSQSANNQELTSRVREIFVKYFSYAASAETLRKLIENNANKDSLTPAFSADFSRFTQAQSHVLGIEEQAHAASDKSGKCFVLFWKQNDTGIYGRRVDMFIKYLAARDDVRKVIVFDASLSTFDLKRLRNLNDEPSQNRLIYIKAYEKLLGKLDSEKVSYNVFIHKPGIYALPGKPTPDKLSVSAGLIPFVERVFKREEVIPGDSIFCIYPKFFPGSAILDHFKPNKVLIDVIDDHRAWPGISEVEKQKISGHYKNLLEYADMAFVNCAPMLDLMEEYSSAVRLVPNGCDESPPNNEPLHSEEFELFKAWQGKKIGFVGNLEAKIDIELIKKIAHKFLDSKIALLGSTHANRAAFDLYNLPNVIMPGVIPYNEVGSWIKQFDVAIIPHKNIKMTNFMNPLKLFVFLQWRVPIVTTDVANIGYRGSFLRTAKDHDSFLKHVASFLQKTPTETNALEEFINLNSWSIRFEKHIDELLVTNTLDQ